MPKPCQSDPEREEAGWKLVELWVIRAESRLDFELFFVLVHPGPGTWASGCGHRVKEKNMA